MKIAVSGSHDTGKTKLVGEISDLLPAFATIEEPYHLLAEEGHVFSAVPSLQDFELQLERSIRSIVESEADVIFDRCPLDFLAYLAVQDESAFYEIDLWLPGVAESVQTLDLVVFVPIENPDLIGSDGLEEEDFRLRVNEEMQEIILGDKYDLGVPVIEVFGSPDERACMVMQHLENEPSRI